MVAKFKSKSISIALPIDVLDAIDNIVKEAKNNNMVATRSNIILDALMCYFKYCEAMHKRQNTNKPEDNKNN